jgi:hypothetical protein
MRKAAAAALTVFIAGLMPLVPAGPVSAQTLTWTVVSSPNVPHSYDQLLAVSCALARFCVAVGSEAGAAKGSVSHPLIETWNGTSWSQAAASTKGAGGGLFGVSCAAAGFCTAVGDYTTNGTNSSTLIETGTAGS